MKATAMDSILWYNPHEAFWAGRSLDIMRGNIMMSLSVALHSAFAVDQANFTLEIVVTEVNMDVVYRV